MEAALEAFLSLHGSKLTVVKLDHGELEYKRTHKTTLYGFKKNLTFFTTVLMTLIASRCALP